MKKPYWIFVALLFLLSSVPSLAQDKKQLLESSLPGILDFWVANAEKQVVALADAMPEDKYSFAPAATSGEFKGVRTFAEQVKHVAALNYWMSTLMLGGKPTVEMEKETGPASLTTKAEIMEYLKGSFAALHKGVATINEQNVVQTMASPNKRISTPLAFVIDSVAHSYDHYGQLVEYLRMNGIIPPASRRTK